MKQCFLKQKKKLTKSKTFKYSLEESHNKTIEFIISSLKSLSLKRLLWTVRERTTSLSEEWRQANKSSPKLYWKRKWTLFFIAKEVTIFTILNAMQLKSMHLRLCADYFLILDLFPFPFTSLREWKCNHKPPCVPVQMLQMPLNHFFPVTPSDTGIFTWSSLHLPIIHHRSSSFKMTKANWNLTWKTLASFIAFGSWMHVNIKDEHRIAQEEKKNPKKQFTGWLGLPVSLQFWKEINYYTCRRLHNIISHLHFVLLKILMLFHKACRNSLSKMGSFPAFERYLK